MAKFNYKNFVESVKVMTDNKLAHEYTAVSFNHEKRNRDCRIHAMSQEMLIRFVKTNLTYNQIDKLVE